MQCSKPDCERPISRRNLCASHYKTWRIRQHAYGRWSSNYVDAGPAREHVAKLRAAGVGTRRINELSGVGRNAIRYLGITRAGRAEPSQRILRTTAERLLAVPIPAAPLELLAPSSIIDATGTIRRLRALVAAGHSQRSIADRLGVSQSALCDLMQRTHCTVRNRDLVAALFAELEHQPGTNDRARQRGMQLGWALPLEWDEDTIDDPSAEPVRARRGGPIDTGANRREAAALAAEGMSAEAIAQELGVHERTVARYLAVAS